MRKLLAILLLAALLCTAGCTPGEPATTEPTYHILPYPLPETTTQPTSTPNNELGLGAIDWTLTVTPISEAGQPLDETHTFTVKGEISDASEGNINMLLDFSFGSDLPYFLYPSELARPHSKAIYRHFGYYTYWDWYFVRNTDEFHMMYCAIDPAMGLAIFYFDDGSGQYYVGSVEPDIDPLSIYAHFSRFVQDHNPAPSEPKDMKVDWTMDTKMVHADGQLISNGTMVIEGSIVKQEDANDLLLLNISLPGTVHYLFTDHTQSDEGFFIVETDLPYYLSMGYCYSILDNEPVFSQFALDTEMGYLIMEWKNLPGQYLIASRDGEVDPAVILAHFQGFIDRYAFEH